MKIENPTEIGVIASPTPSPFESLKKKINPISESKTTCPAVIFAKRRIVNAKGLTNIDIISIGIIIQHSQIGAPPRRCFNQCPIPASFIAVILITKYAVIAKAPVTAIAPVAVCPPGINPNILQRSMKQNNPMK